MRQWPPAGETPPPAAIDDPALRVALARSWGVRARHLQYLPKGMGSYHWVAEATAGERFFVTVDDLDRKPWLGTDRDGTFAGLNTSYETASMLHRDAGHAFVVAPLPGRSGGVLQRLTSRYCLSVFPYIEGQAGLWGEAFTPEKSVELAWLLAELHRSTPVVASRALRRGLALPGRVQLEAALDDLDPRWAGGPYSEVARQHLAGHAGTVREWLREYDQLADRVGHTEEGSVITHGEPHPGNLIHGARGLILIDWDTVALARPERDVWMLDDGTDEGLAPYVEASGRTLDPDALAFHRLAWTLTDVAAFTEIFRSDHEGHAGTEIKLQALIDALSGPPPDPHARLSRKRS